LIILHNIGFDLRFLCRLSTLNTKFYNFVYNVLQQRSNKNKLLVRWFYQHHNICQNPKSKKSIDVKKYPLFFDDVGVGIEQLLSTQITLYTAFGQYLTIQIEGLQRSVFNSNIYRLNETTKDKIFIAFHSWHETIVAVLDLQDPVYPTMKILPNFLSSEGPISDFTPFSHFYCTTNALLNIETTSDSNLNVTIFDVCTKKQTQQKYLPQSQTKILFSGPLILMFGLRDTKIVDVLNNFQEICVPGLIVGGEFNCISFSKYYPTDNVVTLFSNFEGFVYKIQLPKKTGQCPQFSFHQTNFALYNSKTNQVESFERPTFLHSGSFVENSNIRLYKN
jgi:hypothetical protein